MALFNKDWNTYKRNWQNANGIGGKIGSLFTPANAITKTDIDAIKAYNAQIDNCVTSQTAFNRTMLNASPAAQNLVASYNGGKVSAQGMATAQNMAKTSTIGLTIAQTALNAAIGMGVGLLINLVVQGVNKLIHANEEAIESAKKLREEYEEFKSTNASNVSTLKELEEEFKELSKGVSQYGDNISLTTEQYERYKEIIQQIVGMSPSLAEGYDTENGYIADKNGLLERAIELQEIEYRNELRKITNLQNLKTSMAGYIAEYKDAFEGGFVTEDMSATSTTKATEFSNALYQAFNYSERYNNGYDSEDLARDIMESLGVDDIDKEMEKFFNENGYYQPNWFFDEYVDEIANNIDAVTDALSFETVGLDENEFENRILTVKDCAQAYLDMKDSISMANESIQTDLRYIAEYADGYDTLSSEQQKFVNEFLKGFNIDDIASRDWFGNLTYDEDKMKSVKRQINEFVEELSQDETTKEALADLYAIPTDGQSIGEFVEQFRSALEIIKIYCEENGIEIPIAITNSEEAINELEAQQQRAVDFAKDKFNGYDPTAFFKENSINTKEEVDKWLEIAQAANSAADAEERYVQGSTLDDEIDVSSITDSIKTIAEQLEPQFAKLGEAYKNIFTEDGFTLENVDNSMLEGLRSSFAEIEESVGVAFDTTQLESFFNVLTNGESSSTDVQNAFNDIATAYLNSTDVLEKLNDETANAVAIQLKQMGVSNAEEIVNSRLTAQKILEKNVITDLTDATLEEVDAQAKVIEQLLNEENASDATKAALIELASSKHQCNTTGVVTDGDVKNLLALAEAAGIAGIEVANAKNSLAAIDSGANYRPEAANNALRADLYRRLQTQLKANYKNSYEPVKYNSTSSSNKSSSSGSSSSKKETEESFNWIERAIQKVQRTITNLGKTISATWKSWTTRNNALKDQISAINSEISTQQKAYDYYMKKANEVGLSKTYQDLVKNGTIRIDTIKDEKLAEKIKAYQDFYDQAIECKDAITDLQDELVELEMTKFDNTAKQFEDQISAIEHDVNMMESEIDLKNTAGYIEGRQAYSSLIQFQRENIALLQKEYSELNKQLNDLTKSGKITEFSEEWYDMMADIQDVEESLIDANTALVEYQNTLRELDWDNFDMLQDRISQITQESEFLRNLISDEDMFNDNGSITKHGQATLGLHAVDYNTYMAQAKSYAEELLKIDKEIANDPNNQKLLERREELLQSQQDMITAAEGEKQAMQDLMREGYDNLLSYMDTLISKRKDALKSIKDLYDYEKSISEQTQEISILEKQLISYQGDDSEETKSKIQQIKVSLEEAKQNLEETEYDKYISDQEQMLDSLKEETEMWVNNRLDNLDGLLQGVIDSTNANATTIADTLKAESDAVSYNLTNSMQSIWSGSDVKDVVSMYGDNFNTHAITINSTLLAIKASVDALFSGSTSVKKYATGGLVNETGFAWLDGTKDKPELVLNAQDTKNFIELAKVLRDVDPSELGLPSMEQVIASGLVTSSMSPILDSMKFKMPDMVSRNTNSQNPIVFNGDIILPDVQTPEEFARKIKEIYSNNTGNVRKVIQTDIYGGMLGKNSYEHRKYM